MDLSKCFDTFNHDLIIQQIQKKITDGSILNLIRQFLESGVMVGERYEASEVGSPQGGVISPLIANIYLDEFDQAMKSRGHIIVRYADDILILCSSRAAAENAHQVAVKLLEGELMPRVNTEKTHIIHSANGVNYLGVVIYTNYTRIQEKKLKAFKGKVKQITKRNQGQGMIGVISCRSRIRGPYVRFCERDEVVTPHPTQWFLYT